MLENVQFRNSILGLRTERTKTCQSGQTRTRQEVEVVVVVELEVKVKVKVKVAVKFEVEVKVEVEVEKRESGRHNTKWSERHCLSKWWERLWKDPWKRLQCSDSGGNFHNS